MNSSLDTHRAELLALAAGLFSRRDAIAFDPEWQGREVRKLHSYRLLSLSAMADIMGVSMYRVEQSLGEAERPLQRGRLNPVHLSLLAYSLRFNKVQRDWLITMLDEGTSISTIADLTGVSRSTLNRVRR